MSERFFLFLSIFGEVVLCCVVLCKKGKLTIHKMRKCLLFNLSVFEQKFLLGFGRAM